MKRFFLLLLTIGFIAFYQQESKAQALGTDYQNAVGGRFGVANGITFKHFLTDNNAIDIIMNFRSKKNSFSVFKLYGLYEIHNPINGAPGLTWYYGVGGGIGSYTFKYKDDRKDEKDIALSADGVLGLDYKFKDVPIDVAFDWKPSFELSPDQGLGFDGFGLSIRFAF